jgi:aryl-alcohol dehydrogenase-like predicted oxidoreductase
MGRYITVSTKVGKDLREEAKRMGIQRAKLEKSVSGSSA